MDNRKTGAFISLIRKERELTQKELAEKIGVTDKAVSRWETGRGFPDISVLKPLSEALGVSITELINGETASPETIQEKADHAVLETIAYFKSMAGKTISMLLLFAGVCLILFSFMLTGQRLSILPFLGLFIILMSRLILSPKNFFLHFKIAVSQKTAQLVSTALLISALILEALPYGAVMNFASGPEETIRVTTSYFNLLPFGYGNFFPFITAVLTVVSIMGGFISIFWEKGIPRLKHALYLCCISILACSGASFLFGITLIGGGIFVCVLAATVFQAAANRKTSA
jgi:transcriptional regulator with XRE-family HTH domain